MKFPVEHLLSEAAQKRYREDEEFAARLRKSCEELELYPTVSANKSMLVAWCNQTGLLIDMNPTLDRYRKGTPSFTKQSYVYLLSDQYSGDCDTLFEAIQTAIADAELLSQQRIDECYWTHNGRKSAFLANRGIDPEKDISVRLKDFAKPAFGCLPHPGSIAVYVEKALVFVDEPQLVSLRDSKSQRYLALAVPSAPGAEAVCSYAVVKPDEKSLEAYMQGDIDLRTLFTTGAGDEVPEKFTLDLLSGDDELVAITPHEGDFPEEFLPLSGFHADSHTDSFQP